jgi:DNA-directed RNA polymerase subunit RPC12/RpoP
MRVRCSFCGAEYDAAVTLAALDLVDRCERCGRAQLRAVDPARPDDDPPERGSDAPDGAAWGPAP